MKTASLYSKFVAANAVSAMSAIKQGMEKLGYKILEHNDNCDVAIICTTLWAGKMAPNREVFFKYRSSGRNVVVLDASALKRGEMWKLGLNAIHNEGYFGPKGNDDQRRRKLNINLKPWKKQDGSLLVCLQNSKSYQWHDMPEVTRWCQNLIDLGHQAGWRNIIVRPHPRDPILLNLTGATVTNPKKIAEDDFDLIRNLKDISAVVSFSSNPGIVSAVEGIPIFVSKRSLAYDVRCGEIDELIIKNYPDREQWINDYVYTEWTNEEIKEGTPLKRLLNA